MKKQIDREQLKKNQLRWVIFIIFISLLVVVLAPRKKVDVVPTPELEAQIKEKVQEAVAQALVENKIEIQKNVSVNQAAVVSAAAQKIFDPEIVSQRRSQAKATMSAMYTAMVSYYAEYGRYTTDLYAAGFSLIGNTQSFKTGFIYESSSDRENIRPLENKSRMNSDFFVAHSTSDGSQPIAYSKEAEKINFKDYEKFCRNKCTADESSFEVISIIPFDDDHVDIWIMNERKEMIQVQDGMQGI